MSVIKGMIQVEGKTYRITRVMPHVYEAVRILDNMIAGWFKSDLSVITPHASDALTLHAVAYQAVKQGKTSWVGRASAPPKVASEPATEPSDLSGVRVVERALGGVPDVVLQPARGFRKGA